MPIPTIGERVVFKSFFGASNRNGETARVVLYGFPNEIFPDKIPVLIRFERDNFPLGVRTDECLPIQ